MESRSLVRNVSGSIFLLVIIFCILFSGIAFCDDAGETALTQAESLRKAKKYKESKSFYQSVSQNSDSNLAIKGLTGVGCCEIQLGNTTAAERVIELLKNKYSKHPDLCARLYDLSYEYWYKSNYVKSKEHCQYIIQTFPKNSLAVRAQRGIARCEIRLGNSNAADQAVEILKKDYSEHKELCSELFALSFEFYWKGNYKKSKAIWKFVSENTSDMPMALKARTEIIRCEIRLRNYNEAGRAISALKKDYPKSPELFQSLLVFAKDYEKFKNYDKARDLYQYVSQNSSDSDLAFKVQVRVVELEVGSGNVNAALKAIEILKKKNAQHPELFQRLLAFAKDFDRRGKYDNAKALCQYVAQNSKDINQSIIGRAWGACISIKSHDITGAEELISTLKKDYPKSPELFRSLLVVAKDYEKMKNYDKARDLYRYVFQNSSDSDLAFNGQLRVVELEVRLGNDNAAVKAINILKKNNAQHPELFQRLLAFAKDYDRRGRPRIAKALCQYVARNSKDINQSIVGRAWTACISIKSHDNIGAEESISTLKKDYPKSPKLFGSLLVVARDYEKLKNYDKARDLYQYVSQNSSDIDLAFKGQVMVAECEVRSGHVDAALKAIDVLKEKYSQHPELFENIFRYAFKIEVKHRKRDKAIDLYQYIVKDCSDRKLMFDAQKRIAGCKMALKDRSGSEQAIKVLMDNFSTHPGIEKAMFNIACNYQRLLKVGNSGNKDDQKTAEEKDEERKKHYESSKNNYSLVINKYPNSSFARAAECEIMKMDLSDNGDGDSVGEVFKEFLGEKSKDFRYFGYVEYILSSKQRFEEKYKRYALNDLNNKMGSFPELKDKKKVVQLLIRFSNYSNYKASLGDFAVYCAKNGECDSIIDVVGLMRQTKVKRFAEDLCKCYLDSNPNVLCRETVTLKLFKIKFEDEAAGSGMCDQLAQYISRNISTNKKLASEAMLLKGRLHIKLGEIAEACKIYEIYKTENPKADNMAEVLYYIGYANLIQGDFERAKSSFDAILKDFPKSEHVGKATQYIQRIIAFDE